MNYKKTKWFIYTVLVGLIPFFSRFIVYILSNEKDISFLFNPTDFIVFGLVLHITNINELENLVIDKAWKTKQNGFSIIFIAFYSILLTISLIATRDGSTFNQNTILVSSVLLSIASFFLSFSIFDYVSKIVMEGDNG